MKAALAALLLVLSSSAYSLPISAAEHEIVLEIGASLGVPRSIANWLQVEESGDRYTGGWGDAKAVGKKGSDGERCLGLYQLNPRFEKALVAAYYLHPAAYFDVFNPCDNAIVALGFLADLHRQYGSWERALWYFNLGRVTDVPLSVGAYALRIIESKE